MSPDPSPPFPCAPATPLRRAPPYHGGRKGKLAVPERSWLIESERRLASLLALGATEPNSRSPRSASTHLCSHKVLYTPSLLRCGSFRCITMISEDGDISALLSEPNLPEEQAVTSGSDDFLAAILESIKSNEKEVELSPEEAAWADSCFVQTSELSDVDWGAMTQALLDTLKEPMEGSCDTTEVMHEQGTHVLSEAESHALRVEKHTQDDNVDMEQRSSSDDDEDATEVDEVTHVIRGADEHGRQMDGYTAKSDDDDELVSSKVLEQAESRDSIFKVWDLDVSFSEDESEPELIKDLKKLLRGNPQEAAYPPPSDAAKVLSEINVDELVAGLSNLSLQRTSG